MRARHIQECERKRRLPFSTSLVFRSDRPIDGARSGGRGSGRRRPRTPSGSRQTDGATSCAHRYSRRKRHEAALPDALSMGAVPRMVGLLSTDSQRSEGRGIRTTRGVELTTYPDSENAQTRTPACEGLNPRVIVQVSPNLSRENNRIGLSNAGGSLVNTRALVHDVPKSRGNPRRRSSAGRAAVS